MIKTYRKLPVEIEAVEYTIDNLEELRTFVGAPLNVSRVKLGSTECISVDIETLEGSMVVSPGDFVIKGINGEFYPCKPDIFKKTYEIVLDVPIHLVRVYNIGKDPRTFGIVGFVQFYRSGVKEDLRDIKIPLHSSKDLTEFTRILVPFEKARSIGSVPNELYKRAHDYISKYVVTGS